MSKPQLIYITHWRLGTKAADIPFERYEDAHNFLLNMYYSHHVTPNFRRAAENLLAQLGPKKLQKSGDLIEARYSNHYIAIGIGR